MHGCPDRDNDNVADKDDSCPDVAGLVKYKGCPIPDTDNDGINDEQDKCPAVAGLARYIGCPVPDTDNDGVNDEDDKCPNVAGLAASFGCPAIPAEITGKTDLAAKNIRFTSAGTKLSTASLTSLNNVVKILQDDPTYKIDVAVHTDNTGAAEKNLLLSKQSANTVKAYLVSKGIDESRITAVGYGSEKPIADNKTAAGRAKNKRVELKIRNY